MSQVPQAESRRLMAAAKNVVMVAVAGAGPFLFITGHAYQIGYLAEFDLAWDGFRDDPSEYVFLGAALFFELSKWLLPRLPELLLWAIGAFLCFMGFGWLLSRVKEKAIERGRWIRKRWPGVVAGAISVIPVGLLRHLNLAGYRGMWVTLGWYLLVIIAMPYWLAYQQGQQFARQHKQAVTDSGCITPPMAGSCIALEYSDEKVSRGFLVWQSAGRIALYWEGRTTTYPMDRVGRTWAFSDSGPFAGAESDDVAIPGE